MKYELAIFDLDGTLLNTLEDLAEAVNAVLSANGYPLRSADEVRRFVGNGIRKLVERSLPENTPEDTIETVLKQFKIYYSAHQTDHTRPYPGIGDLLMRLKASGMRLAMISNKADSSVQVLAQHYFPGMFDAVAGEKEGIRRKPAPDAVNAALETLQVPREKAVYIGDSEVDIRTAHHARMDAVLVTWGFREQAQLEEAGARVLAGTPQELLKILTAD